MVWCETSWRASVFSSVSQGNNWNSHYNEASGIVPGHIFAFQWMLCVCVCSCVCVCVCVCVLLLSRVRIFVTPDCSPPGPSVHGIPRAKLLEWAAISSSRASFQPRDWTQGSCISLHWQADSLPLSQLGSPRECCSGQCVHWCHDMHHWGFQLRIQLRIGNKQKYSIDNN